MAVDAGLRSEESTLAPSVPPSVLTEKHTPDATRKVSQSASSEDHVADLKDEKRKSTSSDESTADEVDDTIYPDGLKKTMITIALCLSVFCMALDNTIIATAIPKITDEFHSINDIGWYGSSYLLTTCALQLIFGKFYTFLNLKWVYMVALAIFELGSLVCAVAPNSTAFIIGRAVAGVGSAGIFSGAILIVANTVPLRQRPAYTGVIGSMYGISSVVGPLLGGVFTDKATWRWCFYINLPFGAVTAIFIIFFFKPAAAKKSDKADAFENIGWKARVKLFDIYGTIVFLPMIVCLLLALQWGGSTYAWKSGRIIALFVLFAVLLAVFIFIQFKMQDRATIPPRVLKQRTVAGAAWFSLTLGAAFFIILYYIPIWFQAIKHVSATKSGIMNLPLLLSLVLISLIAGGLVTTFGYYTPFVIASSIFMSIGAGLLSTFHTNTGHSMWIGYQVIFGLGVGMGMQQTLIAVQAVLPKKDVPIGTAIIMFSQTLGGALFISVAQNVETNQLIKQLAIVVPDLNPAVVLSAGATELQNLIPSQYLKGVEMAYNTALTQTFYVAVALSVASIFGALAMEWKSVKGKKIEMAAA